MKNMTAEQKFKRSILIVCCIALGATFPAIHEIFNPHPEYKAVYIDRKARHIGLTGFEALLLDSSVSEYILTGSVIEVGDKITHIKLGRLELKTDDMLYVIRGDYSGGGGTWVDKDSSRTIYEGPIIKILNK